MTRFSGSCLAICWMALFSAPLAAQDPLGLWQVSDSVSIQRAPDQGASTYVLTADLMDQILASAPLDGKRTDATRSAAPVISLPMPDGSFELFRVVEAPILAPELAARYPQIRDYRLVGANNPALHGRLGRNSRYVHALVLTPEGGVEINPVDGQHAYSSGFGDVAEEPFSCGFEDTTATQQLISAVPPIAMLASGSELRSYRLAVATTAEYYQGRGNSDALVLESIATVMSRVNTIYEAEVAITFVLIPETDQLFSQDPNDFSNTNPATMREENQVFIDSILDDDDYDIGHVFGTSPGGGNAAGSVVCVTGSKARGASGLNVANDAATEIAFGGHRLVAHEIGHQFGAGHTWSGALGSCTAAQFSQPNAYEPLSGTTLMAYPGTCGADNIAGGPAANYLHTHSYDQIINFSVSGNGNTCAQITNTGNAAPIVNAGPNFTIPAGTPFTLTGEASDPDGDVLTYTWEQYDVAPARISPLVDQGDNPLFRSFPPGPDVSRTFPQMSDVLAGPPFTLGEVLPAGDRTMTFRFTARDNRSGGGGVEYDTTVINVVGSPFFVTYPNGGESLAASCPVTATWTVGGGDVANSVNLLFSSDSGNSFPDTLAANVTNDGSQEITVPCLATNAARIRAEAVNNIFFDVSDNDFSITTRPDLVLDTPPPDDAEVDEACEYEMTFSATVTHACAVSAADVDVQFSVFNDLASISDGTFQANQIDASTVQVTGSAIVSGLTTSPVIARALITAADGCGFDRSIPYDVAVFDNIPPEIEVVLSPPVLWPPNHTMRTIAADVVVTDNCPLTSFVLLDVTSSEPDNATGDGDFPDDIQGVEPLTPDTTFQLRAERMGSGPGRVYTATYRAEDGSGNTTEQSAEVRVPKAQNE